MGQFLHFIFVPSWCFMWHCFIQNFPNIMQLHQLFFEQLDLHLQMFRPPNVLYIVLAFTTDNWVFLLACDSLIPKSSAVKYLLWYSWFLGNIPARTPCLLHTMYCVSWLDFIIILATITGSHGWSQAPLDWLGTWIDTISLQSNTGFVYSARFSLPFLPVFFGTHVLYFPLRMP